MTLKNARRRLAEIGYELEPDVRPYKYKMRRVGTLHWTRHHCLYTMLASVTVSKDRVAA